MDWNLARLLFTRGPAVGRSCRASYLPYRGINGSNYGAPVIDFMVSDPPARGR
jgi:hypothetical protein